MLCHEIGHNCTLYHAFDFDYCNDTNGHSSAYQSSSFDNNMMGYNGRQNSLTVDQVTRWHHYLNEERNVIEAGNFDGSLACSSSASGGALLGPTTNTQSASVTLSVVGAGFSNINWTEVVGSGNLSVSNNGQTVNLTGLGSMTIKATWQENCMNFGKFYTLFNQSF